MAKCIDCGLLALREHHTMRLVEAPELYRRSGKVPLADNQARYEQTERIPVCAEQIRDIEIEFLGNGLRPAAPLAPALGRNWDIDPGRIDKRLAYEILHREYPCPQFIKHRPGMSPQEHREMLDRDRMLKWQTDRENADREWRNDEAKRDREWRREERQSNNRWHLLEVGTLLFGIIVAAAITLAAAFISRNGPDVNQTILPGVTVTTGSTPTPATITEP